MTDSTKKLYRSDILVGFAYFVIKRTSNLSSKGHEVDMKATYQSNELTRLNSSISDFK